jgi:allantoinase
MSLPEHGRFAYSAIGERPDFRWPNGSRLAVYIGFNLEHFAFGEGRGAKLAPPVGGVDVLNASWREYGNRVGAWRCLDLFDALGLPVGAIVNTALIDHAPGLVAAFVARGDELIGHGHTNSQAQGDLSLQAERALLAACRDRLAAVSGRTPGGWLSPWISESRDTPDLLVETGYRYTLNWCHDDQPVAMHTRAGPLWSVPYPQELNDIPAIVARQMTGRDFADMIVDQFDEMLEQSQGQSLVMGIALHPYLVGQPHRLRPLRRALAHVAASKETWWTTPAGICDAVRHAAPP